MRMRMFSSITHIVFRRRARLVPRETCNVIK